MTTLDRMQRIAKKSFISKNDIGIITAQPCFPRTGLRPAGKRCDLGKLGSGLQWFQVKLGGRLCHRQPAV
jgi:hypothetical protein